MFNMVEITENILSFLFVYFFFSFFPPPTSPLLTFLFLNSLLFRGRLHRLHWSAPLRMMVGSTVRDSRLYRSGNGLYQM